MNALLADMSAEASAVVAEGSFGAPTTETRIAFMRYVGQGHEIPVPLPVRVLTEADVATIRAAYDTEYSRFFDRPVPGSDVEIMSYAVVVATIAEQTSAPSAPGAAIAAIPVRHQQVRDTITGEVAAWAIHDRTALSPGATIAGPAIIAEDETSTLVGPGWTASINGFGYIELTRGAAA